MHTAFSFVCLCVRVCVCVCCSLPLLLFCVCVFFFFLCFVCMVAFFLVTSQSQLAESYRVIAQTPDLPWIWHMTGTSPLGQLTEVVQSLPEHALLL